MIINMIMVGANSSFALFGIFVYWSLTKSEVCRIAFVFVVWQEGGFFPMIFFSLRSLHFDQLGLSLNS